MSEHIVALCSLSHLHLQVIMSVCFPVEGKNHREGGPGKVVEKSQTLPVTQMIWTRVLI